MVLSNTSLVLPTFYIESLNAWTGALDPGLNVDAIYLEYFKAFDSVSYLRLISKLQVYSIRGNLLKWIKNLLSRRQWKVTLNDGSSQWIDVISGVPQGSVFGPLLFILYIYIYIYVNDITHSIKYIRNVC